MKNFEDFISPEPNTGCHLWTGVIAGNGRYGNFNVNGKYVRAHRHSWELANNTSIPEGKVICHTCDNGFCVNPDHLFMGTQADNMQDAGRKGKMVRECVKINASERVRKSWETRRRVK